MKNLLLLNVVVLFFHGLHAQAFADQCTIIPDFEFVAEDIKTQDAPTPTMCCYYCVLDTRCVVWTFDNTTRKCTTKHTESVSIKTENKTSGRKNDKYVPDATDWQTLVDTDFKDGNTDGWRVLPATTNKPPVPVGRCVGETLLGGVGKVGKDNSLVWKTRTDQPFKKIKIWFRYWFLASWDSETAYMTLNGERVWTSSTNWLDAGHTSLCGLGWTDFFKDFEVLVNLPTQTNNIEIEFATTLDQTPDDEAFSLSHFKVATVPDYTSLPAIVDVDSIFGFPVSIYLSGVSNLNDSAIGFRITSLPTFGKLEDPSHIANNQPYSIKRAPYNITATGFQKVTYIPPSSSNVNKTQFSFVVFVKKTGAIVKQSKVVIHLTKNLPYDCANNSKSVVHGEVISVSQVNHNPIRVNFQNAYRNPVVFAMPLSSNGGDPAVPRITSVNSYGFSLHVQEPPSADGVHTTESVSALVLEVGSWRLADGTHIEVGKTITSATLGTTAQPQDSWSVIEFPSKTEFSSSPVVLAQVQTDNDPDWVKARVNHVSTSGFAVSLEEVDENSMTHGGEIVGWVAIEVTPTSKDWGTRRFSAQRTADQVSSSWFKITFNTGLQLSSAPLFLADMQSHDNSRSSHLRHGSIDAKSVQIKWESDLKNKPGNPQATEIVGYIAISSDGELTAFGAECFSNNKFVKDTKAECIQGQRTIISLSGASRWVADPVKITVLTLPSYGKLSQYERANRDAFEGAPITDTKTVVTDPRGRVVYHAFSSGSDSITMDSFTFMGESTNQGFVSITVHPDPHPPAAPAVIIIDPILPPLSTAMVSPPNIETPPSDSHVGTLTALLVLAFILIAIMMLAIIAFGFFLYKKEGARKEMVQLFLGESNNRGETTYFPEQFAVQGDDDNDV